MPDDVTEQWKSFHIRQSQYKSVTKRVAVSLEQTFIRIYRKGSCPLPFQSLTLQTGS